MGRRFVFLLIVLASMGCSTKPRVVVASKNFTESVIISEIAAQQIERRNLGLNVDRKFNLGGTLLAHEALKSGSIDVFPEYTGTALTVVLKKPPGGNAKAVLEQVRDSYRAWGLEWLPTLGFNNSYAMVVRTSTARENGLKTMTDAARRSAPWHFACWHEFVERPDGLNGLLKTYDLRLAGNPITMDLGLLYPALRAETADLVEGGSTDGALVGTEFTVLEDDRHYFPPYYEVALIVRAELVNRYPNLRAALTELSGKISDQAMRQMNKAVDIDHRPVEEVARDFLIQLK